MGFTAVSAVVALVTTAVTMSEAQRQRDQQEQVQRKNAAIAAQQAAMQEEEGRQARRDAYDAAQRVRQQNVGKTAAMRARMAASGAQVDQGSSLDSMLSVVDKGELDALQVQEQGNRAQYAHNASAWSLQNQADALRQRADFTAAGGTAEQMGIWGQGINKGAGYMQQLKGSGRLIA